MDLRELQNYLNRFAESLRNSDRKLLDARLESLMSAFPFNKYEYALMFLLDKEIVGFSQYEKLREAYVSSNRNLHLYELAPRIFGEIWAQQHIQHLDARFAKPTRSIDPDYEGQYDLSIHSVRVEVKAARAINTKKRGGLVSKALRRAASDPFWMNFQQIKVDACDVFIFMGVWVDEIVYWVLSKDDVRRNKNLSHQHRGGIEYQIGITDKNIAEFDRYVVDAVKIGDSVIGKGKKNKK
jgi:hypothetical protein